MEAKKGGKTRAMYDLLLAHGGSLYSFEIAAHFGIPPNNVSALLSTLRKRGYLIGEKMPGTQKQVSWSINPDSPPLTDKPDVRIKPDPPDAPGSIRLVTGGLMTQTGNSRVFHLQNTMHVRRDTIGCRSQTGIGSSLQAECRISG